MRKPEFSKILLFTDYLFMVVLLFCTVKYPDIDFITLDVAWIAQLAVSTGFYFWKAKTENRTKVPINVIQSLPKSMREGLNLTEVIVEIIKAA